MTRPLSSRERLLRTLEFRAADYVPCCFSAFSALRRKSGSQREYIARQLDTGLDTVVELGDLPVSHDPRVTNRQWSEATTPFPVLHSEYTTPAGTLKRVVKTSEDWEHGDTVPFLSDFIIARASKHLVTPHDSLDALGYLLAPPSDSEKADYVARARALKSLAAERALATTAGYGMHGDLACWLSGIREMIVMSFDEPEFAHRYLALIERWNRSRMEIILAEKPDIYIRRGWYEHADIWSPQLFREFILPALRRDAEQVHTAGAKFGYLMSCSSMPLLDMIMEAQVDVLLGVDPAQDRMLDLSLLKEKTHGKMAIWGGVCGYLTMERGTADDIRAQVRDSVSTLSPGGGFILAPVTNVRGDTEQSWRNVHAMIDEWKLVRA